ncbi:MAG: histidine phosphatase family protein [Candidatus Velthaea sp.]
MEIGWPAELVLIRHAESAGNVARAQALEQGALTIDISARDCDVPLSNLGERQAEALGAWLARTAPAFDLVLSSPYLRARETATLALAAAHWNSTPQRVDERLREKEFGALDRLTRLGILDRFPDQNEMRLALGKFYYRPPGGESWTDVVLRLRNFVESLLREAPGRRVAIVTHQVIVLCFRYILEDLSEQELLAIDRTGDVANCSLTTYRYDTHAGRLKLIDYNLTAPLQESGETVTAEPDVPVAPN